jgi:glycerol-3-phosphate O-acyltransferase
MLNWLGLDKLFTLVARKLIYYWIRTKVLPENLAELDLDPNKPVCYVLQTRFLSNLLVLETETRNLKLPRALSRIKSPLLKEDRAVFFLTRSDTATPLQKNRFEYSPRYVRLVQAARANPELDVQLVPVSILWGRSPDKENSIFKILFADSWATPGTLKQIITVMLHGRQTLVKFSAPVSLRSIVNEGLSEERCLRKLSRVLRVHFHRQREVAIGPDLSHRRTLVNSILAAPGVQTSVAEAAAKEGVAREVAEARARQYAQEIAADYSHPIIRLFDVFLTWLWTRLYDGVEVHHFEDVAKLAHTHEIIYVPCHRSHIDYLLLSYVIYHRGLMTPHIAAGANLNIPVAGSLMRRAGAFFLRRSFKGNQLYGTVFNEYLHLMISKGYSIEYFIEGGRSRTGRLLQPRPGMLSMTVRSYLRDYSRPIAFVPAYIGYERLFEGRTYIGELQGKAKKKENIWDLLMTVRKLKKQFGQVHLNFGEPILLEPLLNQANHAWRETSAADTMKTPWLTQTIDVLAETISTHVNQAAVINPINLLALALLSSPKHAMDEDALVRQIGLYRKLVKNGCYSNRIELTTLDSKAVVAYGQQLNMVQRRKHPLGDLLYLHEEEALLLTYFRNNVLHVFALPSLVACLFLYNGELRREQVIGLVRAVYPFLRSELFLPWAIEDIDAVINQHIDQMIAMGLLIQRSQDTVSCTSPNSEEYAQLTVLGRAVRQTVVRYYMVISLLTNQGSGNLSQKRLEDLCYLLAQRLSFLYEFNAPEFFDKALFRNFIDTAKKTGHLKADADNALVFDARLVEIAAQAQLILPADIRQTTQQITRVSDAEVAAALTAVEKKTEKRTDKKKTKEKSAV